MNERYDVAVIGAGVGGLNAALVLARARRRVLIVDAGQPRNAPAAHLHGFLTRDGDPPGDLLAIGRTEVAAYGGEFLLDSRVVDLDGATDEFVLTLDTGRRVTARRVLLATGLGDQLPEVPGLAERWGRDVLHCPYCHGYEVADQPLGVLGGPDGASQAMTIRHWSTDVTLFTNGSELERDAQVALSMLGIEVVTTPVTEILSDADRLTGVQLAGGRVVTRAAVFVTPVLVANDTFLGKLDVVTYRHPRGTFVSTDSTGRTSIPGLWAVGNIADPSSQLVTAAGDGARAAIDLNTELIAKDADDVLRRQAAADA